jgi:hypothetical protein
VIASASVWVALGVGSVMIGEVPLVSVILSRTCCTAMLIM